MRHRTLLLITLAALGAATLTAGPRQESSSQQQWPRFRGPSSNPISDNPNLPLSWSKTENVEWVADVPGVGWSSPVVWGSRVFLTAATSDTPMKPPSLGVDFSNEYMAELRKQGLSQTEINKKLYERDREMPDEVVISLMLYCYDLETGKKLWERQMYKGRPAGGRHSKNSFASETPTTDGERVYVYLTDYRLFAFDFDGKPSWTTPLKAHATTRDWAPAHRLRCTRIACLSSTTTRSKVSLRRSTPAPANNCGARRALCNRRARWDGRHRSSGRTACAPNWSRSAPPLPSATAWMAASCGG